MRFAHILLISVAVLAGMVYAAPAHNDDSEVSDSSDGARTKTTSHKGPQKTAAAAVATDSTSDEGTSGGKTRGKLNPDGTKVMKPVTPTGPPLQGSGTIGYNIYSTMAHFGRTQPPFCGYNLSYDVVDLGRVAAFENLLPSQCGTCVKITSVATGKSTTILAIDHGGKNIDLSDVAYPEIFGSIVNGRDPAKWETVSPSECADIYL